MLSDTSTMEAHNEYENKVFHPRLCRSSFDGLFALITTPAIAEYGNALNEVKEIKAIFDVSQGSPKVSNIVFWAVKNVYEDESVKELAMPPQVAIVFHGPEVKL